LQNTLLATYEPSYINIALGYVRNVFTRARIWRYIIEDPSLDLERLKEREKTKIIPTEEQVILLINNAELRDSVAIAPGALAGLRISEVFGLMWKDIDFSAKEIHIQR
jgi:integrase